MVCISLKHGLDRMGLTACPGLQYLKEAGLNIAYARPHNVAQDDFIMRSFKQWLGGV